MQQFFSSFYISSIFFSKSVNFLCVFYLYVDYLPLLMMNYKHDRIILASASPRRKELLENAKINFDIIVSGENELANPTANPRDEAIENARIKASSVARKNPNRITLGADTVVAFDGKIYGKPKDIIEAKQMLSQLQGNTHSVFTGVCAAVANEYGEVKILTDYKESLVTFKQLSSSKIDEYLTVVNVLDKAGAYAAQEHGEMIIEKIVGNFDNVMGLPVETSKKILDTLAKTRHT